MGSYKSLGKNIYKVTYPIIFMMGRKKTLLNPMNIRQNIPIPCCWCESKLKPSAPFSSQPKLLIKRQYRQVSGHRLGDCGGVNRLLSPSCSWGTWPCFHQHAVQSTSPPHPFTPHLPLTARRYWPTAEKHAQLRPIISNSVSRRGWLDGDL